MVVYWLGGIVIPRLTSLAFPSVLDWRDLPAWLNPDAEVPAVVIPEAGILLVTALLALYAGWRDHLARRGWITVGGWLTLAVAAAVLGWEEAFESKRHGIRLAQQLFGEGYGSLWPLLVSPLILGFALAMAAFVRKGVLDRQVRVFVLLGFVAWVAVLFYETVTPWVFGDQGSWVGNLIEETLEVTGALLFGLAAVLSLQSLPPSKDLLSRRRLLWLAGGATAITVAVSGLAVFDIVSTWRESLADTRGPVVVDTHLPDGYSLVQELGMISAPLSRIELRAATHSHPGIIGWRIRENGIDGAILREGRIKVDSGELRWHQIDFPPILPSPLAVQLVASTTGGDYIRFQLTKTARFAELRFWIQGEETWPDQKLEILGKGSSDLTRSKLMAFWQMFQWSWVSLAVTAFAGLWAIVFAPALIALSAWPQTRTHDVINT